MTIACSLLFVVLGCQPEPTLRENIDSAREIVDNAKDVSREILGEEKYEEIWGNDEEPIRTPDVVLKVSAGCENGMVSVNVIVINKKTSKIYVCSSDFTLKLPGGLTLNPTSDSVNTFEAIELNNGETAQGIVYFKHDEIGKQGIYYLNFNHHSGLQQFGFRKK